MMNQNSKQITVILVTAALAIVGLIAICGVILFSALSRAVERRSALGTSANANRSVAEYNRRGNEYYQQGLYKRAATEYGHMIEKAPNDVDGYMLRGIAEEAAGDHKKAILDATDGLKHTKNTMTRDALYYNRGLAYRNLGQYEQALPDFSQAIALNRNNGEAYEIRAFCYLERKDYDRAIADYTVAIGFNPHPGTVFERGQAYLLKKDYPHALQDLNRSLKDRPNFVAGYRLRAEAYCSMQAYDQALADAETMLRMENSPANRGSVGWIQYLAGKLPESIASSEAAIKLDPSLTFARFNLALCYAVQGHADTAKAAYEEALPHAKAADIQGALQDVKDAQKKQSNSPALKQAETLLQNALPHASAS